MSCITISIHTLIVASCWLAGLALGIADALTALDLTALAVSFMVVGATVLVKSRVDRYAANWTQAYEMGRDAGREPVRRLH